VVRPYVSLMFMANFEHLCSWRRDVSLCVEFTAAYHNCLEVPSDEEVASRL
jgi:hypothetical protein